MPPLCTYSGPGSQKVVPSATIQQGRWCEHLSFRVAGKCTVINGGNVPVLPLECSTYANPQHLHCQRNGELTPKRLPDLDIPDTFHDNLQLQIGRVFHPRWSPSHLPSHHHRRLHAHSHPCRRCPDANQDIPQAALHVRSHLLCRV